ncbi:MAG: hypothetical protein PWQ77_770 [Kosmotogales bacterium]|nr:hypothetical protein [Kosmotogales bacterium]
MSLDSSLIIDINSFKEEKKIITKISNSSDDLNCIRPIEIDITLKKEKNDILVTGKVKTTIIVECARCLKPIEKTIEGKIEMLYVGESTFDELQREGEIENLDMIFPITGEKLDLSDPIIEAIIIEVPVKALCSVDCKGLCPSCGTDLNENPDHVCEDEEKSEEDKWHQKLKELKKTIE